MCAAPAGSPPVRPPPDREDPFQRRASNQAPPLVGHDGVGGDAALTGAVRALAGDGADPVLASLADLGHLAGTAEAREHGVLANTHVPLLRPVDRYGRRVDEVDFHPSWHWLMARAVSAGLQGAPWVVRHAPPEVADAFTASRLGTDKVPPGTLGTLPVGVDVRALVDRALPRPAGRCPS